MRGSPPLKGNDVPPVPPPSEVAEILFGDIIAQFADNILPIGVSGLIIVMARSTKENARKEDHPNMRIHGNVVIEVIGLKKTLLEFFVKPEHPVKKLII